MSQSAASPGHPSTTTLPSAESGPADSLADALFAAFVYVADVGSGITASDVDAMHAWVRRQSKVPNALQPAIDHLSARFLELWKRHVASGNKPDSALIAKSIWHWKATANEANCAALDNLLASLLDVFAPTKTGMIARVRGRPTPQGRINARQHLDACLAVRPASPSKQGVNNATTNGSSVTLTTSTEADGRMLPGSSKGWRKLRCVAVIDETQDVKTFVFEGTEPQIFAYNPGQFITIQMPIAEGKKLRRSYTLSSSPSRPHRASITVKRIPNGRGSNWLHEHVETGFECQVSGPHGEFTCGIAPSYPKLLLIAAGSGITPIASMLRWLADSMAETDLVVINNVRTPDDVIFDAELRYLASRLGTRCRLLIVPSRVPPGRHWLGPIGRFNRKLLDAVVPDCLERQVYTCGPSAYMAEVREILCEGIGLPKDQYHEERFGSPPVLGDGKEATLDQRLGSGGSSAATQSSATKQPGLVPANKGSTTPKRITSSTEVSASQPELKEASQQAIIVFKRSGVTAVAAPGDNLLETAEDHAVDLPSSCRSGDCGTCKVRKISGEVAVDWDAQSALSVDEIQEGWILCCISDLSSGSLELDA